MERRRVGSPAGCREPEPVAEQPSKLAGGRKSPSPRLLAPISRISAGHPSTTFGGPRPTLADGEARGCSLLFAELRCDLRSGERPAPDRFAHPAANRPQRKSPGLSAGAVRGQRGGGRGEPTAAWGNGSTAFPPAGSAENPDDPKFFRGGGPYFSGRRGGPQTKRPGSVRGASPTAAVAGDYLPFPCPLLLQFKARRKRPRPRHALRRHPNVPKNPLTNVHSGQGD